MRICWPRAAVMRVYMSCSLPMKNLWRPQKRADLKRESRAEKHERKGGSGQSAIREGEPRLPVDDRLRHGARRTSRLVHPGEREERQPPVSGSEAAHARISGALRTSATSGG